MQLSKVEHAKTQNQHVKIVHSEYILILRMSTTLTSGSRDDFGSFTNKPLNPYDFCIWNSSETYFGTLESPVDCQ